MIHCIESQGEKLIKGCLTLKKKFVADNANLWLWDLCGMINGQDIVLQCITRV